jgi:hypothetical protein
MSTFRRLWQTDKKIISKNVTLRYTVRRKRKLDWSGSEQGIGVRFCSDLYFWECRWCCCSTDNQTKITETLTHNDIISIMLEELRVRKRSNELCMDAALVQQQQQKTVTSRHRTGNWNLISWLLLFNGLLMLLSASVESRSELVCRRWQVKARTSCSLPSHYTPLPATGNHGEVIPPLRLVGWGTKLQAWN